MGIQKTILKSLWSSNYFISTRCYANELNPATKTWSILTKDIPTTFGGKTDKVYPEHADVVIIGGGCIGSAVAYSLKTRAVHGLNIVVLEKDITFKNIQSNLSLGAITQHYSLPENINLSQHSVEFMRNVKEHLGNDVDLEYIPSGSLVLASEKYADKMEENATLLKEMGTKVQLLNADEIKERFPWLNTSDVKLGCIGYDSEGTFNPWALHKGFLKKSIDLGVEYLHAEVIGFEFERLRDVLMEGVAPGSYQKITRVIYKTPDGEEHKIKFAACILAAGDQSGQVAKLAKVGTGDNMLSIPLPVDKREYKIYSIARKASETGLRTPMITDSSGLWLKRIGLENDLLFGMVPSFMEQEQIQDQEYYKNIILTSLLNRIPSCSNADIKCLSTEMHDCSTYDNTGILGIHPYHNNLYIATGFGKQGCQHSPGIGRAIAELVIDSKFTTIDFTRFAFDRFLTTQPLVDFNAY